MIQKVLGLFFVFVLAPCGIGPLFTAGMGERGRSPVRLYLSGFLTELAVFQLIAVPIMIREPFGMDALVIVVTLALALLMVAGGFTAFVRIKKRGAKAAAALSVKTCAGRIRGLTWECRLFWLIFLAVIGFQVVMSYLYASFDGDDAYYVVQSVLADQTGVLDRIRPYTGLSTDLDLRHALAALPLWIAYVSRMTGIHAAIVAHTLLPLVLIPLTYAGYLEIGGKLFAPGDVRLPVFLALAGIAQIFGNISIYTNATFFLMRTWQGKSILANLVLLVILWLLLEILDEKNKGTAGGFWALLIVVNIVSAMMTSMGTFLAAMFIGIAGIVAACRQRSIKLLFCFGLCCLPNLVYLVLLLLLA